MRVLLTYPRSRTEARHWIGSTLLSRLVENFECTPDDRDDWLLQLVTSESGDHLGLDKELRISDAFFQKANGAWLRRESLPSLPLGVLVLERVGLRPLPTRSELPVLYGEPVFSRTQCGQAHLGIDIFGSAFFMLSRYEELLPAEQDEHGRFPASASIAVQAGILHRPLIDEYVELLWETMNSLWPRLQRRTRKFRMLPSHDVDAPSRYAFQGVSRTLRESLGDGLKRNDWRLALRGPWQWLHGQFRLHPRDVYNTFDWIMDRSEAQGVKSAFYFVPGGSDSPFDPTYDIRDRAIQSLMARIHRRGHEIGLHPSYESALAPERIVREAARLRVECDKLGIDQPECGARMHYLRWKTPVTMLGLEEARLDYDTTLSYASHAGFRCGTCLEYPAFDVVSNRVLRLRIRPLIAMDDSIRAACYMGLGNSVNALETLCALKSQCRMVAGDFTLLWHNSNLCTAVDREMYNAVLIA